ncbi:anaphase-promoting complex subunit 5-like isoform X1 [Macrosteles quadrilineatus]|uniref:anaphase-promoting complex subunit 5-like isoform X1 n=2 Tax=Macrosteles quadrilineatus TaxID=74068 RepID=UPI0023E212AF|nr:anaphase-promoting complex subunit 5-like isoform X1 [Macrosteles quadrilineatus]
MDKITNKDSWFGGTLSKKSIREHITPHKISVVILIQEYCNIKAEAIRQAKKYPDYVIESPVEMPYPVYRRSFCMLILHLIQCPDMDYAELVNLLKSSKYYIVPDLLKNFLAEIDKFAHNEVGSIQDAISNLGHLLIDSLMSPCLVNKGSPIGVYLRRVMLFFDKLNFSQTISLYLGFKHYVLLGQQSLKLDPRCNLFFKSAVGTRPEFGSSLMLESIGTLNTESPIQPEEPSEIESVNMDLSSVSTPRHPPAVLKPFPHMPQVPAVDSNVMELSSVIEPVVPNSLFQELKQMDTDLPEELPALWSRRQAELFIARQTAGLQNNESSALPPAQLQNVIRQVLKANPEHYEAHYLSYLNCLRVKEFSGALDSLYHYFDRNTTSSQDKEAKGYRYAALNLAILHAQFGHKSEALAALKEAIWLSHEVNDNVCLQHAQAWLYKLTEDNKEILMERSISKCSDLSLNYLTSLGLQSFAQFAGTTGGKPALVFEVLMRSDVLNCQFSMMDLVAHSMAHKAALWTLYGKADMASLSSQLLLHLDSVDAIQGLNSYNGEATCQAICGMALRLTELGEYDLAMVVVDHARERYPNSSSWQLSEQVLYFTRSLYRGQWHAAHTAVRQMATLNKWEALLREGELLMCKGDSVGAIAALTTVLDGGPSLCPSVRVRALLLAARASQSAAVCILTAALSIANYHYLDYLTALVAMQLAYVQLQMNLPNQALKLMDQSLLVVLSHGGHYDQASAIMLFVQCKVASVASGEPEFRREVIADAIRLLTKVKDNFLHMEAYTKAKEAVYLQALLANELGCYAERNKFSYEFRQLDEEYPTVVQV